MNLTFLNKTLKRQAGFTLTEMMIGGSILAGVGLAGAMLFKEQKMAQKKIDNMQTLNIFHQNLARQMNNPFNCNATFKQYNYLNQPSIPAGSIDKLYMCGSGCTDFKSGATGVGVGDAIVTRGTYIDAYPDATKSTQLWNVKDIKIPTAVTASGPLLIKVVYELNQAKFPGTPEVSKDIILTARFSTTGTVQFKECLNSQESSVNNLQNDICKSMSAITSSGSGVTAGAGGGVIAQWDEATQSCKTVGNETNKLKSCPAGMVVEGIRSDGSVHCKYPTTGIGCPPGQTGKLKMSGGSMKVVCE